ncbi:MAG: ROK family protein [Verrucomicrobiales bacterium]|nr:ROK family protein [Verrucomicrobiales bacterium]
MAEATPKQLYLGVDLGGTKILAGVFGPQLKLVATSKTSTKADRGPKAVIERIARTIRDAVDEADQDMKAVKAIGIGAPGSIDSDQGRVIFSPNMPGWEDVLLKKELEKHLEIPVFVENDCNACTLGVHVAELGAKPKHLVGIFLGTGIGAGIILDGKLFSGFNRTAGEIGHMVLEVGGPKCGCGNKGCFEALASRTAIFRRIQNAVKDGQKTHLVDMLGDDLDDLRSGDLRKAIRKGDKLVEKVVEEAAEYTGIAVGNVINLLNPECIVLGGGVIDALEDDMMSIIVETAKDYAMPGAAKGVEIVASRLADHAGITGAAALARENSKA